MTVTLYFIQDQYQGLQTVFKMAFDLLRVMARGNPVVQRRLFDRLDLILGVKGAEPEMANALKEASQVLLIQAFGI